MQKLLPGCRNFSCKNGYQDVGAVINNRNSPELLMLLLCQAERVRGGHWKQTIKYYQSRPSALFGENYSFKIRDLKCKKGTQNRITECGLFWHFWQSWHSMRHLRSHIWKEQKSVVDQVTLVIAEVNQLAILLVNLQPVEERSFVNRKPGWDSHLRKNRKLFYDGMLANKLYNLFATHFQKDKLMPAVY